MSTSLRVALAATLALAGCASIGVPRATDEQMAEHEHVYDHALSKSDAFSRISRWVAETYASAEDVVQLSDPGAGTVVARGAMPLGYGYSVPYRMTIDVRDNRVRFAQQIQGPGRPSVEAADDVLDLFSELRADAMSALSEPDDF